MSNKGSTDATKSATGNSDAVLFELAGRAGTLFRKSNADALACGRVLLEAREIAGHGKWLSFLRDADMPARTAQRLMKAAEFVGDSDAKNDFLSHFGVSRTLDFIRASGRAMAAWRAACVDDPTNIPLITDFEIDVADVLAMVAAAELPLADEASAP